MTGTPAALASPTPRSIALWLAPAGALTALAIGILWAIPRPAPVCIEIYPVPPECLTGGDPTTIMPALVLLVLLYAALVASTLLVRGRYRALVLGLECGALGLVFLVGLVAALSAANLGLVGVAVP